MNHFFLPVIPSDYENILHMSRLGQLVAKKRWKFSSEVVSSMGQVIWDLWINEFSFYFPLLVGAQLAGGITTSFKLHHCLRNKDRTIFSKFYLFIVQKA